MLTKHYQIIGQMLTQHCISRVSIKATAQMAHSHLQISRTMGNVNHSCKHLWVVGLDARDLFSQLHGRLELVVASAVERVLH